MILLLPLAISIFGAGILFCLAKPGTATRVALVLGAAEVVALGDIAWQVYHYGVLTYGNYLRADGLTSFFLINIGLTSALVLVYASGYMQQESEDRFFSRRWFYALVFLFLFTMLGVCLSSNLGLLWIMMEGTTLASALLVGYYNTEGAVEAGWKYLVVCTVGIAFALFGTIVLYLARSERASARTWRWTGRLWPPRFHGRGSIPIWSSSPSSSCSSDMEPR